MNETPMHVLVVDDDMRVARINAAYVEKVPGFRVAAQAHSAAGAMEFLAAHPVDLILLDHYLPDGNGLDLVRRLRERGHGTDVIMVTAARDLATVQAAMRLGALQYLVKPFTFAGLRTRLEAYGSLRRTLDTGGEAEQAEVDRLFGALAGAAPPTSSPRATPPPRPSSSGGSCAPPTARCPRSRSRTGPASAGRPPSATSSSSNAPAASHWPCATARRDAPSTATPGSRPRDPPDAAGHPHPARSPSGPVLPDGCGIRGTGP